MSINIQVFHDSDDITQQIIEYQREQVFCNSTGFFSFKVPVGISRTFYSWDEVVLYEDSIKKGTYYINSVDESIPDSTITIDCQDTSKKLTDYLLDEALSKDYETTTKYWIEIMLNRAGVDYNFIGNVGDGQPVMKDEVFGFEDAYSIMPMV